MLNVSKFSSLLFLSFYREHIGQARRLTPVYLSTWEAEIWRIEVGGEPRQIV
jgi:hypothetical protein